MSSKMAVHSTWVADWPCTTVWLQPDGLQVPVRKAEILSTLYMYSIMDPLRWDIMCNYSNCPFFFCLAIQSADPAVWPLPPWIHNMIWTPTSSVLKVGSYWATLCRMCSSTHCSEPLQNVSNPIDLIFTCLNKNQRLWHVSTVEVFVTRIKTVNRCLIAWSFPSEGLGFKGQKHGIPKVSKILVKKLLWSKAHQCTVLWRKIQKHCEWNVMCKMLKHHLQNRLYAQNAEWLVYAKRWKSSYMYQFRASLYTELMWLSYTELRITAWQQTISNQLCCVS